MTIHFIFHKIDIIFPHLVHIHAKFLPLEVLFITQNIRRKVHEDQLSFSIFLSCNLL